MEDKTKEVLEFIISYIEVHCYAPSVREIAQGTGLKSSNTAHLYLKKLKDQGIIETDAESGSPRAIRVKGYKFMKVDNSRNPR